MNVRLLKPLAGLALALAAGFSQAAVIDFTTSHAAIGPSFADTVDGIAFNSNSLIGITLNKTALVETIATKLTVSTTSGLGFDLNSFQLADVLNLGLSNNVLLAWTFENGTTGSTTLTLDKKRGFQTFDFSSLHLDNLASFTLKGGSNLTSFQLDNLNVTVVPEPGSVAMLLAGLGLLGTVARRRRQA